MTETRFIQKVHRQLPQEVYRWKIKDDYAGGVPDAWYCGTGGDLFVEYKYVPNLPKKESTKIKANLSELQILWLTARQAQNKACIVIVGTPNGGVIFTNVQEAREGIPKTEFENRTLAVKDIATAITDYCQGKCL